MIRAPMFRILGSNEAEPRGLNGRRNAPREIRAGPGPAQGGHDGPHKRENRIFGGRRAMSAVPRDLEQACRGLRVLVGRIARGGIGEEVLREEVDRWKREDCKGAAALRKAANFSLRYELASEGLRSGGGVPDELRALGRVEEILEPPEGGDLDGEVPVEVALSEDLRRRLPGAHGFRMGELQIILERGSEGLVISVSHPNRNPTWDELRRASLAAGPGVPALWALMQSPGSPPRAGGTRGTVYLRENPPRDPPKPR